MISISELQVKLYIHMTSSMRLLYSPLLTSKKKSSGNPVQKLILQPIITNFLEAGV